MSKRDSFLLRIDPKVLDAVRVWAKNELRSVNGHIEFLLRKALKEAGREARGKESSDNDSPEPSKGPTNQDES